MGSGSGSGKESNSDKESLEHDILSGPCGSYSGPGLSSTPTSIGAGGVARYRKVVGMSKTKEILKKRMKYNQKKRVIESEGPTIITSVGITMYGKIMNAKGSGNRKLIKRKIFFVFLK